MLDTADRRAVNRGPFDSADLLNGIMYPVVKRYSEELKGLVRRCLSFEVGERPSLEELKGVIGERVGREGRWRERVHAKLVDTDPFGEWGVGKRYKSS